jgi:hypothetical protein
VVIVHEWNAPELVARIGRHRAAHGGYRLLSHDTRHRSVSARDVIRAFQLDAFDTPDRRALELEGYVAAVRGRQQSAALKPAPTMEAA